MISNQNLKIIKTIKIKDSNARFNCFAFFEVDKFQNNNFGSHGSPKVPHGTQ